MWLRGYFASWQACILVATCFLLQVSLLTSQYVPPYEPYALPYEQSDATLQSIGPLAVVHKRDLAESCPVVQVIVKVDNDTLETQLRTCGTSAEERFALENNYCAMAGVPTDKIVEFLQHGISAFPPETWSELPLAFLASIIQNASSATRNNAIFPELFNFVAQSHTLGAVAATNLLDKVKENATRLEIPESAAQALPAAPFAVQATDLLNDTTALKAAVQESAPNLNPSELRQWSQIVYLPEDDGNPIRQAFQNDLGDFPEETVKEWLDGKVELHLEPAQGANLLHILHPKIEWAQLSAVDLLNLLTSVRPLLPYLSYTELASIPPTHTREPLVTAFLVEFAKKYPEAPFARWVAYRFLHDEDYASLLATGPALAAISTQDLRTLADKGQLTPAALEELAKSPHLTSQDLAALKHAILDHFDAQSLPTSYLPLTNSAALLENGTSRPAEDWNQVTSELSPSQLAALARHLPVEHVTDLVPYWPLENVSRISDMINTSQCTLRPEYVRTSLPTLNSVLNYYNACFTDQAPPTEAVFNCHMVMEAPLSDVIDYLKHSTWPLPRHLHTCFLPRLYQWVGVRLNTPEAELLVAMEPSHFRISRQLLLSFHPFSIEQYLYTRPETCPAFFQALMYTDLVEYTYEELSVLAAQAVTCFRVNTTHITLENVVQMQALIYFLPAHAYAALSTELFRFINKQRSVSPDDVGITYPACRNAAGRSYLYQFMVLTWGPIEHWNAASLREIGCLATLLKPDDHYMLARHLTPLELRGMLPLWSACLARAKEVTRTQFCATAAGNNLYTTPSTALADNHDLAAGQLTEEEPDDVFRLVVQRLARQRAEQAASIEGRSLKYESLTCNEVAFAGCASYDKTQWARLSYNELMECLEPVFLAKNPHMTPEEGHALWGIIRCKWGVPDNVPAEVLTELGPVALGIPLWHLRNLNLSSWDAIGALGSTKGWKPEQVKALAQAVLNSHNRRIPTDPYHIELLGAVTCGLSVRQLKAILTPETLKKLGAHFFSSLEACSREQLEVMADMAKEAIGTPDTWDSLETETLSFVALGLDAEDFTTLAPEALEAIHSEVRERLPEEILKTLPMDGLLRLSLHGLEVPPSETKDVAVKESEGPTIIPVQCLNRTLTPEVVFNGADFHFGSPLLLTRHASRIARELRKWNGTLDAGIVLKLLGEEWSNLPAEFWEELPNPLLERFLEVHLLDEDVPVPVLENILLNRANDTDTPKSVVSRLWDTVASQNGSADVLLATRDQLPVRVDSNVAQIMQSIGTSPVLSDLTDTQLSNQPWPSLMGAIRQARSSTYYSKLKRGAAKKPTPPTNPADLRLYLANFPRESARYDITPTEWRNIVSSRFPPVTPPAPKPVEYSKDQLQTSPAALTIIELADTPYDSLSRLELNNNLEAMLLSPDLEEHASDIAALLTSDAIDDAPSETIDLYLDHDVPIAPHTVCSFAARVAQSIADKKDLASNWTFAEVLVAMDRFDIMQAREALLGFPTEAFETFVYEFHDTPRCSDFFTFLGTLDLSSANGYHLSRLAEIGLHCFADVDNFHLNDAVFDILGALAPHLESDFILQIPVASFQSFLDLHGASVTPQCADERKRAALRKHILDTYPPVSEWTRATIQEIGCMITVLAQEDIEQLAQDAIFTWAQILPTCREQLNNLHKELCNLSPEDEASWSAELDRTLRMQIERLYPAPHAKCEEINEFAGSGAVAELLADNRPWEISQLRTCAAILKRQRVTVPLVLAKQLWKTVIAPQFKSIPVPMKVLASLGSLVTGASADELRASLEQSSLLSRVIRQSQALQLGDDIFSYLLPEWTTYEWKSDQARVLLNYLFARTENSVSELLGYAGSFVCALDIDDITRMSIDHGVWGKVPLELFENTKTCNAPEKRFLLTQIVDPSLWPAVSPRDVAYYRYLWAGLSGDDWRHVPATAFRGLSDDVINAIPKSVLNEWTEEQVAHLGDLEKQAYFNKLGLYYDLQPCLAKPVWSVSENEFAASSPDSQSPTSAVAALETTTVSHDILGKDLVYNTEDSQPAPSASPSTKTAQVAVATQVTGGSGNITEKGEDFSLDNDELSELLGASTVTPSFAKTSKLAPQPSATTSRYDGPSRVGLTGEEDTRSLPVTTPVCERTALVPPPNEVVIEYRDPKTNEMLRLVALDPVLYYEGYWCTVSCPNATVIPRNAWNCIPPN